jgi:hypothetical protein
LQLINAMLCYNNANFPTVSHLFTNALKMVGFVGSRVCDLIRDHGLSSCYCCAAFQNPLFYSLSLLILFSKLGNSVWGDGTELQERFCSCMVLISVYVYGMVAKRFSC